MIGVFFHSINNHKKKSSRHKKQKKVSSQKEARLCLNLGLKDVLKDLGISGELGDTLTELLDGHLVLVEVETEVGLVVDVGLLLKVKGRSGGSIELLWDWSGGVEELLKEVWRDSQVIATSELGDLTNVSEGSTHDDGVVAELLVVVEDGLDGSDTWVLLLGVLLLGRCLVPVKDTTNEWGDEESTGLSGGNSLGDGEQEGKVGVDTVVALKDTGGLDTLPGGGNLDQDAGLVNTCGLVKLNDVKGLVNGSLGGERETGIDLSGDLSWDNLQDLLSELDEELVEGSVDLLVDGGALVLTVGDGGINEAGVLWLLGSSEDQRWVGGSILWLVLANGSKVTRVGDNGGARGLQLVEGGRHDYGWRLLYVEDV